MGAVEQTKPVKAAAAAVLAVDPVPPPPDIPALSACHASPFSLRGAPSEDCVEGNGLSGPHPRPVKHCLAPGCGRTDKPRLTILPSRPPSCLLQGKRGEKWVGLGWCGRISRDRAGSGHPGWVGIWQLFWLFLLSCCGWLAIRGEESSPG